MRKRRILLLAAATAVMAVGLSVMVFKRSCAAAQHDFIPVSAVFPEALRRAQDSIPKYRRPEESTYLTFMEWYQVFNPQEYAEFIAKRKPSGFPYLASIRQCWTGFCETCGATRERYPFNGGNYLMLTVIGVSFTAEYAIKGAWENTLGRFTEWTAGGQRVSEDDFAARAAYDYGAFIPTDPWYMFPFPKKLSGVWSDNPFWGHNFIRKCERKVFLTLEFGVKSVYAWLIKMGTHSVYGIAETEVYASLLRPPDSLFTDPRVRRILAVNDSIVIVTLPHYQGFTDAVPGLARNGAHFLDVCGNDEIMVTVIAKAGADYLPPAARVLFFMPVVTAEDSIRITLQVPVVSLAATLNDMPAQGARLEHLFDY